MVRRVELPNKQKNLLKSAQNKATVARAAFREAEALVCQVLRIDEQLALARVCLHGDLVSFRTPSGYVGVLGKYVQLIGARFTKKRSVIWVTLKGDEANVEIRLDVLLNKGTLMTQAEIDCLAKWLDCSSHDIIGYFQSSRLFSPPRLRKKPTP